LPTARQRRLLRRNFYEAGSSGRQRFGFILFCRFTQLYYNTSLSLSSAKVYFPFAYLNMKKFVLFLLLALASPLLAQDNLQTLRGIVADETGEALIGATVVVKNSKGETLGGASTLVDGKFTCLYSNMI
jgi:hypothetical protein